MAPEMRSSSSHAGLVSGTPRAVTGDGVSAIPGDRVSGSTSSGRRDERSAGPASGMWGGAREKVGRTPDDVSGRVGAQGRTNGSMSDNAPGGTASAVASSSLRREENDGQR